MHIDEIKFAQWAAGRTGDVKLDEKEWLDAIKRHVVLSDDQYTRETYHKIIEELRRYSSNETIGKAWVSIAKIVVDAAIRLKRGELTREEIQNLCHDLSHTVPVEQFAQGCIAKMKEVYGSCPLVENKIDPKRVYVDREAWDRTNVRCTRLENELRNVTDDNARMQAELERRHKQAEATEQPQPQPFINAWEPILKVLQSAIPGFRERDEIIANFWRELEAKKPSYKRDALAQTDERLRVMVTEAGRLACYQAYIIRAVMIVLSQSNPKWFDDQPVEYENMIIDCVEHLGMTEAHACQFVALAFHHVADMRKGKKHVV